LTRPSDEITLKEIIVALEGSTFEAFCDIKHRKGIVCTHFSLCKLKPVWYKTQKTLNELYRTITLKMIAEDVMGPAREPELIASSRKKS
jgi:DNA-binding IscR family transcriptional regulator